ncbi:MAG: diaminopimelate decarboxylase [Candidatus Eremiobacteraeota bacterium]|nr:diaminopimelate decarboxylase [Candidatus Eremiobacteraeota bacterium]
MRISGVEAEELARVYATPVLVINVDAVDAAIVSLQVACAPHDFEISYAAKAFICVEFARHLAAHPGIGLDVCSLGELLTAERAGFARERLTFHGAGKSDEELQAVAEGRVGCIVVDGLEELKRLARLEFARNDMQVMLRINTGIEAHTHAFIRTGGSGTKFGFSQGDEEAAAAVFKTHPRLRFSGLHAHIGSQIYETAPFVANSHALIEAAARFACHGLVSERIVVGGGFGVQMQPEADDQTLDVSAALSDVARCVRECASALAIPAPRVAIEPGRSVVANAGTTLYRVLAIKRQDARTFAIVDGGMFENPRPALYGALHHVSAVTPRSGELVEMTICGRTCENDELVRWGRLPEDLEAGDLLAMRTTGAYTYSMASNYNRFMRPAVAAVLAGEHRLWIAREELEDVLRHDVHPAVHAERS